MMKDALRETPSLPCAKIFASVRKHGHTANHPFAVCQQKQHTANLNFAVCEVKTHTAKAQYTANVRLCHVLHMEAHGNQ